MTKRVVSFLLIISFVFLTVGCWNYQEIRNITNVSGIAVDKGDEKKYKLYLEVIFFEPSVDYEVKAIVIESEADSIFEALRGAISITGRRLYLGHCKVVIFSEDLVKEGIEELLDFFLRDHEVRLTVLVFITKEGEAEKIFKETGILSKIASYEIEKLVRYDIQYASLSESKLFYEVMNEVLADGIELTIPFIRMVKVHDKDTFEVKGIICFKDEKMLTLLEEPHTKMFLLLADKLKGTVFTVPGKNEEDGNFVYEIKKTGTKLNFKTTEQGIKMNVSLKIEATVGTNQNSTRVNYSNIEYQEIFTKWLEQKLIETFNYIKEDLNSDICGFEQKFQKLYNDEWLEFVKSGQDFISLLDCKVTIDAIITHRGNLVP